MIKDLQTFQAWPATMEHWDRMFTEYPTMVREIFNGLFAVDGKPQQHLAKRMMPIINEVADRVQGQAVVYQVDVDQSPDLAKTYAPTAFRPLSCS